MVSRKYKNRLHPCCCDHFDLKHHLSFYDRSYKNNLPHTKPSENVPMVFNVGPNFLQFLYWDKISKCTQVYLFDHSSKKNRRCRLSNKTKLLYEENTPETYFITQINVFKCKCICKDCLLETYFYNLGYFNDIVKRTLSVINHIVEKCHSNIFTNEWTPRALNKLLLRLKAKSKHIFGFGDTALVHINTSVIKSKLTLDMLLEKQNYIGILLEMKYSILGFLLQLMVHNHNLNVRNSKFGRIKVKEEFRYHGSGFESSGFMSECTNLKDTINNNFSTMLGVHYQKSPTRITSLSRNPEIDMYKISGVICIPTKPWSSPVLISTGKEKKENIDGFRFISFKTEHDMVEYTNLENDYKSLNNNSEFDNVEQMTAKIVPTKTNDITKIKGWRKKIFTTNSPKISVHASKPSVITPTVPLPIIEIRSESVDEVEEVKLQLENVNQDINQHLLQLYAWRMSGDPVLKNLERTIAQNGNKNNSAFESEILNEYLQKGPELDVSYKIPTLNASEKLCLAPSIEEAEEETQEAINKIINNLQQYRQSLYDNDENENPDKPKVERNSTFINGYIRAPRCEQPVTPRIREQKFHRKISMKAGNSKDKIGLTLGRTTYGRNDVFKRKLPTDVSEVCNETPTDPIKKLKIPFPLKTRTEFYSKQETKVAAIKETVPTVLQTEVSRNGSLPKKDNLSPPNIEILNSEGNCKLPTKTSPKRTRHYSLLENYVDKEDIVIKKLETPAKEEDALQSVIDNKLKALKSNYICLCKDFETKNYHENCGRNKHYNLGMLIYIGYKRPFKELVTKNLELLKNDDTIIDTRLAWIAASAVLTPDTPNILNRFIVPVNSKALRECISANTKESFLGNIMPTESTIADIAVNLEVKQVLDNIVDYTVRKFEIPPLEYDPDVPAFEDQKKKQLKKDSRDKASKVVRELRKLINVSIVDVYHKQNGNELLKEVLKKCNNEFCLKGCVCDSLNSKTSFTNHCGKINCMFECSCPEKKMYFFGNSKQSPDHILAKEEMTWHQTVIRKSNSDIEVMTGTEKSKREKKLPTRYRNNVLLGKEMCCIDARKSQPVVQHISHRKVSDSDLDNDVFADEPVDYNGDDEDFCYSNSKDPGEKRSDKYAGNSPTKSSSSTPTKSSSNSPTKLSFTSPFKGAQWPRSVSVKQHILNRRLGFCINELHENQSLADVFIWCTLHNKYNCLCVNWVSMLKRNVLLWKPERTTRYLANKVMFDIHLEDPRKFSMESYVFNTHDFSARTYGSFYNYRLRNRSSLFKKKRGYEIKHNILSYSNSYVKIKLFVAIHNKWTRGAEPKDPSDREPNEKINYVNIHSKKCKDKYNCIIDVDSICYEDDIEECDATNNYLNLEPSMNPCEEVSIKEEIDLTPTNIVQNNVNTDDQKSSDASAPIEASENQQHSSSLTIKNNLVEEPESVGFKLSETLRKNSQDEDGLPKHGLLCLTPGIGYLRVIEFTPTKLSVQDPQSADVYHTFNNLECANQWLNRFFKNRLLFDSIDTELKWIIVKPGILKLKQSIPFHSSILEDPSVPKHISSGKKNSTSSNDTKRKINNDQKEDDVDGPEKKRRLSLEQLNNTKSETNVKLEGVSLLNSRGAKNKDFEDVEISNCEIKDVKIPIIPTNGVFTPSLVSSEGTSSIKTSPSTSSLLHVPAICNDSQHAKLRTVIIPRFATDKEKDKFTGQTQCHRLTNLSEHLISTAQPKLPTSSVASIMHKDGQPGIMRNNKFYPINATKLTSTLLMKTK